MYAFVVMQLVARESAAGEGEDDREEPDNGEAALNYVLDKYLEKIRRYISSRYLSAGGSALASPPAARQLAVGTAAEEVSALAPMSAG